MATFTATAAQANAQPFLNVNGTISRVVTRNVGGTAISAGDVWQMVKIPSGAVICDMSVAISSSVQSYTMQLGDGNSVARYLASQSLVLVQMVRLGAGTSVNVAPIGYQYTADDTIDITWSTVTSGTAANADVTLAVSYTLMNAS